MNYSRLLLSTILIFTIAGASGQDLVWTKVAEGVWKTQIGKPETYDLFTAAGITPNLQAIRDVGGATFPFDERAVVAALLDPRWKVELEVEAVVAL